MLRTNINDNIKYVSDLFAEINKISNIYKLHNTMVGDGWWLMVSVAYIFFLK